MEVAALARRLPQALRQIDSALRRHLDAGHLGIDHDSSHRDPATAVEAAIAALQHAQQALADVSAAIDDAHIATADMHHTERPARIRTDNRQHRASHRAWPEIDRGRHCGIDLDDKPAPRAVGRRTGAYWRQGCL